jgi:DNA polymerase-4
MIIFHIDVNSAYLSWQAAYELENGSSRDLRTLPAIIGGDQAKRHGIVLAKSIPAKKQGILTGESLMEARLKCPGLLVIPPNYQLFAQCSEAMYELLLDYSPQVQRYSVDECFLDYTASQRLFGAPEETAHAIRNRIKEELGFTVNIGISSNKLLAKMGGELQKPDQVHTLFPAEIMEKMWPLPVGDLFMVGRATRKKLKRLNIQTIGELANSEPAFLRLHFKSYGTLLWQYANGIDDSLVRESNFPKQKGIGNSTTISFDVTDRKEALLVLLSLTEKIAIRMRRKKAFGQVVAISIKSFQLERTSHQRRLAHPCQSTRALYEVVEALFDEAWTGTPIRHLGVRISDLTDLPFEQLSLFDSYDRQKDAVLDATMDKLRKRYGEKILIRGCFPHSGIKSIQGGVAENDDYPIMTSLL